MTRIDCSGSSSAATSDGTGNVFSAVRWDSNSTVFMGVSCNLMISELIRHPITNLLQPERPRRQDAGRPAHDSLRLHDDVAARIKAPSVHAVVSLRVWIYAANSYTGVSIIFLGSAPSQIIWCSRSTVSGEKNCSPVSTQTLAGT